MALLFSGGNGARAQVGADSLAPWKQASSSAAQDAGTELENITVTGYVVPRAGDGPEPVTTLNQDFITKQTDQTVADVLLRLPENFAGFTPALNAGESTAEGGSAVNLLGLGANATLVLIDGRRQVNNPSRSLERKALLISILSRLRRWIALKC